MKKLTDLIGLIGTNSKRLSGTMVVLLAAAVLADSMSWGSLHNTMFSSTPGVIQYNVAGAVTAPVFEQPEYILSKSARLELPALELAEGITMTDAELEAEQKLIAARSKVATGKAGAAATGTSGASISYGSVPSGGGGQSSLSYWKGVNSDTVAFLHIPGTAIDYPVMRGTSYEHRQFDGSSGKKPGSLWVHTGSLSSRGAMQGNTVITGHNWGNCTGAYPFIGPVTYAGRMDQLLSYTSPSFAASNPYITLSIPGDDITLAVIAAFYVPNIYNDSDCIYNGDPVSLAASAKARSLFGSGIEVSSGDRLVTFFTCSRYLRTGALQRFVVVTKIVG